MLGRAGTAVALIDPHKTFPPDFRCEKLDGSQIALLRKTGLADVVLAAAAPDDEICIAHNGRIVARQPHRQCGILYDTLVNTVRGTIPPAVDVVIGKVSALSTTPERQRLTLASGEEITARLVVLATGLNITLRHMLGVERETLSAAHSVSVGFDVRPAAAPDFPFRAMTYYPGAVAQRMAFLTLFPVATGMRANLFLYRDMADPLLRQMRDAPREALRSLMPGLENVTGPLAVEGFVKIRPIDLCRMRGYVQPGVVLVGDAFGTSCPAAGTGVNKVLTDVERLCNVHIPSWLAGEGMGIEKIRAFYDDPVKRETDAKSLAKAMFVRSISTDPGALWAARRRKRRLGHGVYGLLHRLGVGRFAAASGRARAPHAAPPPAAAGLDVPTVSESPPVAAHDTAEHAPAAQAEARF